MSPRIQVAPHDGCVDWNFQYWIDRNCEYLVAPHDGCVDWNCWMIVKRVLFSASHPTMGAWIEIFDRFSTFYSSLSHPTMGAWIEIRRKHLTVRWWMCRTPRWVRGLKLAWFDDLEKARAVAPHDGCVDWNISFLVVRLYRPYRTPRWVRGLKYFLDNGNLLKGCVAPHDGCVDWNGKFRGMDFSDVECHIPYRGAWIEMRPTV